MNPTAELSTAPRQQLSCVALVGNPNVGKTSLFNRLTNLLAKTANFAGTTVEVREATVKIDQRNIRFVDLPGLYSLDSTSPEEQLARSFLAGKLKKYDAPQVLVVVVDATHLERTLFLVGQARELGVPLVVAVNMVDLARKQDIRVNYQVLGERVGCPVVPISARTGEGLDQLQDTISSLCSRAADSLPIVAGESCQSCSGCAYADGYRWAATVAHESTHAGKRASQDFTDSADQLLTHPLLGAVAFGGVMLTVFASIFWLAQFPMTVFDSGFGMLAEQVAGWLPEGGWSDLMTEGVIAGVGSVLIFLPQICILFFALTLLEDCGYLSRAVLVVDRWMRKAGLPGQAFVPLLAAHACAIPAIMSTRVIASRRDRLAAILVIPLMTCSARLPVYSMVAALLFPNNALYAALLFAAAYCLGMVAAFATALLLRVTVLPGSPAPLILDLPPYRLPSLANACRQAWDRGWAFVRDAGTVILAISITIWALSNFPKLDDARFQQQLAQLSAPNAGQPPLVTETMDSEQIELLRRQLGQEHSILGRTGKFVQPVFEPLGFDWKTSISVLASFAAREVVVSTMSVLYGAGEETQTLIERIRNAKRADGTRAFGVSNSISLMVFFVLAMQCLPTQAVTRKETGSWKWAGFQLVYMTLLAYGCAFLAKQVCDLFI